MKRLNLYKALTIVMIGLVSCSSCKESKGTDQTQGLSQEESIELNRGIFEQEEEDIDLFIERYGWVGGWNTRFSGNYTGYCHEHLKNRNRHPSAIFSGE